MNYYLLNTSGRVLVPFSFAFLFPISVSFLEGESFLPFIVPFLISFIVGLLFIRVSRKKESEIFFSAKNAYVSVAFIWLIIPLFGSIPFLFYSFSPIDAFFESFSGFTTTGASVLTPEVLPKSIQFWRSFIQWLGGFGVVVLTLIFLPHVHIKSALFQAEYPAIVLPRIRPRVREVAIIIFWIYILLTFIEIIILYIFGVNLFDALNHSLTTISTGGFSTSSESIAKFQDVRIEAVIAFFAFLGGMNFAIIYALTNKQLRSLADLEFRYYVTFLLLAAFILTLLNLPHYGDPLQSLRFSAFHAISIMTTTGFTTTNFNEWSDSAKMFLITLMLIGGCTGSTAGGLKVIRIVILAKYISMEIQKIMEPRTVRTIKYGNYSLEKTNVEEILAFFILYIFVFFISALLLSFLGYNLETSLSLSASSLGNVGPSFGYASKSVSGLDPVAKLILIVNMWIGRLEILPVFMFLLSLTRRGKW